MIEYLDGLAGSAPKDSAGISALAEAVPLSDQWMLLLTLVIRLLIVPAFLFYQRMRASRHEMRRAA